MEQLKYRVIKSEKQYNTYCEILEDLIVESDSKKQDEIELLTLLIEKWDEESNTLSDKDPIEILKSLMNEHALKAKDLVNILQISKSTISKILNYQKG
jgi:HTH-type transcriptional regulator/antitoxin HigA